MDAAQGKHLRYRRAADRQHPGHPDRGRHRSGVCDRLRRLRALRLPRTRHRLCPAWAGGARHARRRPSARTCARGPRRGRRLRHADARLLRPARLLGALYLSRRRHGGFAWARAYPAVALARGHGHRLRAVLDAALPRLRPVDGGAACVPYCRRLHPCGAARGVRLHVWPLDRGRRDRADLVRVARRLSVRRHGDRADELPCRHGADCIRDPGCRHACNRLARAIGDRGDRRRRRVRLHRLRRVGRARQPGHAGDPRRPAARHRAERHRSSRDAAPGHGRNLRRRLRRRGLPRARPLVKRHRPRGVVGDGDLRAAGIVDRTLRPHRASRPLDPVCDPRRDSCCGLRRRDRNPRPPREPAGADDLDCVVRHRIAWRAGAGADFCA